MTKTKLVKGLTVLFGAAALSGCATMNYTGVQDCVARRGTSLNAPIIGFSNRNDSFSEDCATARAATTIASMRRADGSPDMQAYAFAVSLYEQSNPKIKEFMDRMLKDEGTSMTQVKFDLDKTQEPVSCVREDTANGSGFKCTGKTVPPAVAATAAAQPRVATSNR